ncbi:unnamed protein product [Ectocarpus sp. CCAP 1310/34]|nr:unnamed protein product [Ectocarpus sp. CCAP 1310/34]
MDAGIGARVGDTTNGDGDDADTNLLDPTGPPQTFDTRFSSMANLSDAENGGLDGLDGSPARSTDSDRGVRPEPHENRADTPGCEESGGSERPHQRDGEGAITTGVPDCYRANTGDGRTRSPTGGGGRAETVPRQKTTKQRKNTVSSSKQLLRVEGRGGSFEEEHAASLIQRSHRRAAAIRRARNEHERSFQNQQFMFGPGFQQQQQQQQQKPCSRATRDSGGESGKHSASQERRRDTVSLTPSEEEERHKSSSLAAKAAAAAAAAAAVSVPKLPIDSSAFSSSSAVGGGVRRAAQREPLAILRQLRDDPEVQPKPKTDQFRLRVTTKSAIEAHIRKTGAARRKPHPLPTGPSWRKAATPMKRVAATRTALTKPRAVSPLHRSVRQVNTFIAATDRQRIQPPSAAARRAHSAPPSRATGRLRCAIFAAETMVEREYALAERRNSLLGPDDSPADDELSRDLLASPLLVPYKPSA